MAQQRVNGVFLQRRVAAYVDVRAVHVSAGERTGAPARIEHVEFLADIGDDLGIVLHVHYTRVQHGGGFAVLVHLGLLGDVEFACEALHLVNLRQDGTSLDAGGAGDDHLHGVGAHLWEGLVEGFLGEAGLVIGREVGFVDAAELEVTHRQRHHQHEEDQRDDGGGRPFHGTAGDASPQSVVEL